MKILSLGQSSNKTIFYKSCAHEGKVIVQRYEGTAFSLCLFWASLDFWASLLLTGKTYETKSFRSGLDNSGVHSVCGGTYEADGCASLAQYGYKSWAVEAGACLPQYDDFWLAWGEVWGSWPSEEGFWFFNKPATKSVSSSIWLSRLLILKQIHCSPFFH